jgi:hypothetical protein
MLWRLALPRAGWWRTTPRLRRRTRPLSQRQSKRAEVLKRPAWLPDRSWSRSTSGGLLSVIGAVPYGTATVFSTIVPPFEAQERRHSLQQGRATFSTIGTEVVRVVDRSGIQRAHKLTATFEPYPGTRRFHG